MAKSPYHFNSSRPGVARVNQSSSPSPSPGAIFLHHKDDAFAVFEKSATINPARPTLSSSVPDVVLSNKIGDLPAASPNSQVTEPSFLETHADKFMSASGFGASATGWQLYRLGTDANAAKDAATLLKKIGFGEAFSEEAVNIAKVLAESRAGGKFALGLIVVGGGVAFYKFWFGHDGAAHKEGVYIKPSPSPSPH